MQSKKAKIKELIGLSLVSVGIGLSLLGVWLCVYGGDYVQHKTYEIQTKTGETLKLSCQTLDMNRSKFFFPLASGRQKCILHDVGYESQ